MAMNDEETVALVAGGHTFGKCHGAGPRPTWAPSPRRPAIEEQGLGWKSSFGSGKAATRSAAASKAPGSRTRPSGTWAIWKVLFKYEWELVKSPAGAHQWLAKDTDEDMVPDAHDPTRSSAR
jgi:catalase-peroxidase